MVEVFTSIGALAGFCKFSGHRSFKVFKYDPPSKTNSGYSVYLLPNLWSYITCDFSKAKILASETRGDGEGFKVELNQWRPYYFASGNKDGYNCKDGLMKLFAVPLPRWKY